MYKHAHNPLLSYMIYTEETKLNCLMQLTYIWSHNDLREKNINKNKSQGAWSTACL